MNKKQKKKQKVIENKFKEKKKGSFFDVKILIKSKCSQWGWVNQFS